MRKYIITVVAGIILGCAIVAQASQYEEDPCKSKYFSKVVNECGVDANDMREERKIEIGAGVDVTLFEDKAEAAIIHKITEEYRYDWQNGEHSAYTVVHVNLFQKIKNIFSKGE
jgi:hypothetical protein